MKMDKVATIDGKTCIGCEQCIGICPVNAFAWRMASPLWTPTSASAAASAGPSARWTPSPFPRAWRGRASSGGGARGRGRGIRAEGSPEVWVFVEQARCVAASVSWELIGHGGKLAGDLGGHVSAVILGHDVDAVANAAIAYGARRAYVIDDPILEHYRTQPYLRGMTRLIEKYRPEIVLFGATTTGRDLGGRGGDEPAHRPHRRLHRPHH